MHSDRIPWLALAALCVAIAPGCARKQAEVSYKDDVAPILAANCASCHVPGQPGYVASGFDLAGYDSLMKGTRYGPVVIPGDPLTSALVMLIEGRADPSLKMPAQEEDTSPIEVYVSLLARTGRVGEAIDETARLLPPGRRQSDLAPSLQELAQQSGDYDRLMNVSRSRGDLLGFAAGLTSKAAG